MTFQSSDIYLGFKSIKFKKNKLRKRILGQLILLEYFK